MYDYWMGKQTTAPNAPAQDKGKYVDPGGILEIGNPGYHAPTCIADYMGTSQFLQPDGGTPPSIPNFSKGTAMQAWAKSKGVDTKVDQVGEYFLSDKTKEFDFVKKHIDAGMPLIVDLPKHTVVCYGYMDGPGDDDWIAVHDTWSTNAYPIQDTTDGTHVIESKTVNNTEWWKFRTQSDSQNHAYVEYMVAWYLATTATPAGLTFGDSFTRSTTGGELVQVGYTVTSTLGKGTADIVPSPLDAANSVLKLTSPDVNSFVAAEAPVSVASLTEIRFDYLFSTPGKIDVLLGDKLLADIQCPLTGPGSVGAASFATFSQVFSLSDLAIDPNKMYSLRLKLSAADDPVCYFDNLTVSNAVPEPSTLALLGVGVISLLFYAGATPNRVMLQLP